MEPTVSIQAYRRVQKENEELLKKCETLRKLINGNWVATQDVQDALEISFSDGLKMFDFGRIAKWNKAPMEGQNIITKFRLCEKTVKPKEWFDFDSDDIEECTLIPRVNPDTHQWELSVEDLILEQQGGII
jgi:hypothetical protein